MRADDWLGNQLDQPMFVVTAHDGDTNAGCLVGFTTQCSIDPLRFIVCMSKNNRTFQVARKSQGLGVHAVPKSRRDLAELFGSVSGDVLDKFTRTHWRRGPHDVPLLEGCSSWFVGRVVSSHDVGDHVAFVIDPEIGQAGDDKLLGFQDVRDIEAGREA